MKIVNTLVAVSLGVVALTAQAVQFDSDVPQAIQNQMTQDLGFMGGVKGVKTSPLHQQIFGKMEGSSYLSWFDSRIKAVGVDDCGSANAVACVIPMFNSNKMWLTQNYIKFSHPQIARLMVVYHEARHSERGNRNWMHATCPDPFLDEKGKEMRSIWTGAALAGEAACDITPFGSYGSSSILLKNISKNCTNCTAKVKMDAGIYADNQLGRITDANARRQMISDIFN